jgi:aminoglycoside phosphotransferase (APT) family kinase protein
MHIEQVNLEEALLCIMHGDTCIHNVIFHPSEPKVIVLIDWENSRLGKPLSDLATITGAYLDNTSQISGEEMVKYYCALRNWSYLPANYTFARVWNCVK